MSIFSLTIDQKVKTTESYIPEFSLSSFFADLGGALGLWLGLGAIQIILIGMNCFLKIKFLFHK